MRAESTLAEVSFIEVGSSVDWAVAMATTEWMWAESGGVVLKEEDREVMEKGRIGALLSSVDAGRKLALLKNLWEDLIITMP